MERQRVEPQYHFNHPPHPPGPAQHPPGPPLHPPGPSLHPPGPPLHPPGPPLHPPGQTLHPPGQTLHPPGPPLHPPGPPLHPPGPPHHPQGPPHHPPGPPHHPQGPPHHPQRASHHPQGPPLHPPHPYFYDNHYNHDPNFPPPPAGPPDSFAGAGGSRFNGRKRPNSHAQGQNDGIPTAKLYVSSVPRFVTEEAIRPLFEPHGPLVEVVLPRDKRSGQLQGYCFVKYAKFEDADRAISALHGQYTFPGEMYPLCVRYADGDRERPVVNKPYVNSHNIADTERERPVANKLYVGSLSKLTSKTEIQEIFSPYGHVEDIYIVRDEQRQSRGCAFVRFSHMDMALAAIQGLHGAFTMRGCDMPLIVRFADPKKPRTGDFRGNSAFGGPNFGSCAQEPMIRPTTNLGGPMGGHVLPHAPYSMHQVSVNPQPLAVPHINVEPAVPCVTEPLPPAKYPPADFPQLQHAQASQQCLQSSQLGVSEKQHQSTHFPLHESQRGSGPLVGGGASAKPSEPPTLLTIDACAKPAEPPTLLSMDPEECDWSEHACPDGMKYYYNCTTCESRWDMPEEYALFQQGLQKQQTSQNSNQHPLSLPLVSSAEDIEQTKKDLAHLQIQTETSCY